MKYKLKYDKLFIFLLSCIIPVLVWIIIIKGFIEYPERLTNWILCVPAIIFMLIISPPIILSLTYIIEDINKSVMYDKSTHSVIIKKGRKEYVINQADIIAAYRISVEKKPYSSNRGMRYCFPWFKYALIIIKERKRFFVTNLLCEPLEILNLLNMEYKDIYYNVPIIDRGIGSEFLTTAEFNKKVLEFEDEFKNHSEQELRGIIGDKKTYTDYSRQAARNLLKGKT
jgi:hypothetical protein